MGVLMKVGVREVAVNGEVGSLTIEYASFRNSSLRGGR